MGKSAAEAFRTFTGIYSLFKCELLSANTKGIHDVCSDLCQSHLRTCKTEPPHHRCLLKVHTVQRVKRFCHKMMQAARKNRTELWEYNLTTLNKATPNTYNTGGLNLTVVYLTAVQVTELSLQQKISQIRHALHTKPGVLETMYILYFILYFYLQSLTPCTDNKWQDDTNDRSVLSSEQATEC